MSTKQTVIAEVLQLSEAERLEVAEAVYESLAGPADPDAEAAWSAEIQRRIADLDAGRFKSVPWSQARRQIAGDDHAGRQCPLICIPQPLTRQAKPGAGTPSAVRPLPCASSRKLTTQL